MVDADARGPHVQVGPPDAAVANGPLRQAASFCGTQGLYMYRDVYGQQFTSPVPPGPVSVKMPFYYDPMVVEEPDVEPEPERFGLPRTNSQRERQVCPPPPPFETTRNRGIVGGSPALRLKVFVRPRTQVLSNVVLRLPSAPSQFETFCLVSSLVGWAVPAFFSPFMHLMPPFLSLCLWLGVFCFPGGGGGTCLSHGASFKRPLLPPCQLPTTTMAASSGGITRGGQWDGPA